MGAELGRCATRARSHGWNLDEEDWNDHSLCAIAIRFAIHSNSSRRHKRRRSQWRSRIHSKSCDRTGCDACDSAQLTARERIVDGKELSRSKSWPRSRKKWLPRSVDRVAQHSVATAFPE